MVVQASKHLVLTISVLLVAATLLGSWVFKGSGRSGQALQKLEVGIHERADGIAFVHFMSSLTAALK